MVFANHRDHLTNTACAHAFNSTNNTEYPAWSQVVGMQCVEGYKGGCPSPPLLALLAPSLWPALQSQPPVTVTDQCWWRAQSPGCQTELGFSGAEEGLAQRMYNLLLPGPCSWFNGLYFPSPLSHLPSLPQDLEKRPARRSYDQKPGGTGVTAGEGKAGIFRLVTR